MAFIIYFLRIISLKDLLILGESRKNNIFPFFNLITYLIIIFFFQFITHIKVGISFN